MRQVNTTYFKMARLPLVLFTILSATISSCFAVDISPLSGQATLLGNTSALPPGWSGNSQCLADCASFDDEPLGKEFMFGPNFTDPVGLTIESCVAFCDNQGSRMAGLKENECRCANIFNPSACFENDLSECQIAGQGHACPGNPIEACGLRIGSPPLFNIFFNMVSQFSCSNFIWPGGATLTPGGSWRFSYFYNDSITARALAHNSVNLPVPVPRGNMTPEICVAACGNAGFTLAGVEFADECYCGDALQSNTHPITDCSVLPSIGFSTHPTSTLMRCTGNTKEFCGGPNIVSVYTLPGTGLLPLIPFNPALDDFCSNFDCIGHT
ncbi:hypothetical protein GALMADRAFT_154961 [Galerina marginata CBS 339.88]|uniref:WSC domain-containing protein n=1 Tax=Galerina marginata (strain CBS 339.88) TaxID=685588 RepID=A0A067T6D4_GALM3|nr:hypothetical protein GALMADRAFT_154961 [Galerina marginata CBS 339.88]